MWKFFGVAGAAVVLGTVSPFIAAVDDGPVLRAWLQWLPVQVDELVLPEGDVPMLLLATAVLIAQYMLIFSLATLIQPQVRRLRKFFISQLRPTRTSMLTQRLRLRSSGAADMIMFPFHRGVPVIHRICRAASTGITLLLMLFGFSGAATAQSKWSACKPVETATFVERIHVLCEQPVDGKFAFFAVSTANAPFAARALSIFEAGQLGDKFVNVLFDPADVTGPSFGCLAIDCRPFAAVTLRESLPGACEINSGAQGCPGFCAANPLDAACRPVIPVIPDVPDVPDVPDKCRPGSHLPKCK